MTRAALGALATALRDEAPRAAMLGRALAGQCRAATQFEDLAAAPSWAGWAPAERVRLGQRAALAAIAPSLAVSIDGSWLGQFAKRAGDDALDWAIRCGATETIAPFNAVDLDAVGASALRAAVPVSLRDLIAPAGPEYGVPAAALAAALA